MRMNLATRLSCITLVLLAGAAQAAEEYMQSELHSMPVDAIIAATLRPGERWYTLSGDEIASVIALLKNEPLFSAPEDHIVPVDMDYTVILWGKGDGGLKVRDVVDFDDNVLAICSMKSGWVAPKDSDRNRIRLAELAGRIQKGSEKPTAVGCYSHPSNAGSCCPGSPELGVAVAVDGRTLEVRRFVDRMITRTTTSNLPPGVKVKVKEGAIVPTSSTELVSVVEMHIARFDATKVVARRIDGRAVPYKALMDELAKPTPVILAKQGQQLDPLFSKMFKPESLVLLLPSSTTPPTVAPNSTAPANRP